MSRHLLSSACCCQLVLTIISITYLKNKAPHLFTSQILNRKFAPLFWLRRYEFSGKLSIIPYLPTPLGQQPHRRNSLIPESQLVFELTFVSLHQHFPRHLIFRKKVYPIAKRKRPRLSRHTAREEPLGKAILGKTWSYNLFGVDRK
jgi:hypothetical protein